MDTPDDVLAPAVTYLRIYFAGMVFNLLYNIGSGILRAIGDSRRPLYVLIVCTLTNLVLDLLFVLCFKWASPARDWPPFSRRPSAHCWCSVFWHARANATS
ncbi:MAG: MATE family efflux transporter [Acutalibacteraceae bacterium]